MIPTEKRVHVNGADIAYFEWPAASSLERRATARIDSLERRATAGDAGVVLLAHATGFHARVWDRTIAALERRPRVISLDMRGHGRSDKKGPFTWDVFGKDVLDVIEVLDLHDVIGVGHSMGGHAMTQAVAGAESRFRRLILIDPVIMDPATYLEPSPHRMPLRPDDHPTSKRKNDWTSWEEMFTRFEARHPFTLWQRDVLEDYCRHGVLPNPDGPGWVLACPPRVEAAIYTGNAGRDVYPMIRTIGVPVTVLRAKARDGAHSGPMDFTHSPTWAGLAGAFKDGRDVYLPQLTHFIPMQVPALVARHIENAAGN